MESEEGKEESQFSSTINFRFNFNVLIDRSKCHAPSVAHMESQFETRRYKRLEKRVIHFLIGDCMISYRETVI